MAEVDVRDLAAAFASWEGVTQRLEHTHQRLQQEVARLTRELEEKNRQLARKNRLADLGEMAAHIAHELRNPLVAVQLYVSLLQRDLPDDAGCRAMVRKVQAALNGLNVTLTDLLHFASDGRPDPCPQRLLPLAEEVVRSLQPQLDQSGVHVSLEIEPELDVLADREMLQRALVNMAMNGVEAMPDGGRLTISAHESGATLSVSVADSGCGISDETRQQLFEPFFTTKAAGTGLGLAIVYRIVEAHHGAIEVRNRPEGGAVFTLRLAAVSESMAA